MENIKLTQEQKNKLLEMCKVLFPKYDKQYFNDDVEGNWGDEYLSLYTTGEKKSLTIHWFEFCINNICPIFTNRTAMFDDIESDNIKIIINPIDYLYKKFKLINKSI